MRLAEQKCAVNDSAMPRGHEVSSHEFRRRQADIPKISKNLDRATAID